MGFLRYDSAGMTDAVSNMVKFVEHMENKLEEIESSCAKIVATWEGEAVEAYEVRKRSWNASADKIKTTIIDVSNRVGNARDNMEGTDKRNASFFQA